ncbi:LytR C-terminal domain-containing protein [Blastococcus brunescens]|uniref:LytR C-terminal domain-containing protein n=1 Tax=Blastococcus brunescens TaxID=1564165 RepID=A0ABZ1B1B7_9ACTN|nr:LytR C-terminal domain-containing protein [Blastococcus sp. BMG 8361]WRL64580.1 LytR C-terminal domain-containing protein [Blastococcus sp. BMG 8361]
MSRPVPGAAARTPEAPRQMSRSRLPLPPVPAAPPRGGARPAAARPAAPLTSVAPFQAVPAPEPLADQDPYLTAAPAAGARGDLLERPARLQPAPAPARPSRAWPADEPSLSSTGRSGPRISEPAPRVPSQTTPSGSSAPAYGDWTKPSRSGDSVFAADPELLAEAPSAPGTTAIPERSVRRRRSARGPVDAADDLDLDGGPAPVRGPGTGPVGGRAAMRAERQAADAVRRKAEGRKGSAVAVLEEDEPRRPRRVLTALLAMTVVALAVLGVYTFLSPRTEEAATQSPANPSASAPVVPDVDALPELPADPIEVAPVAAAPVRVPVTVLNSTDINGLAAKVSGAIAGGGWETPAVGAYLADDVAASTVFFTEGDENQRVAATQLIEMFPQLQGPTVRFFELPADVQAPGLVVVTTGDWQP